MEIYIPFAFFTCAFVLRFFDKSARIYNHHFKHYDGNIHNVYVSLQRMKNDLKNANIDSGLKKEIRKAILYRRLHYLFVVLLFTSILTMSFIKG